MTRVRRPTRVWQRSFPGTFLDAAFPEGGFATYADVLMEVGRTTEVNPYVLASMILVEQGSSGTGKCISGTVSGYEGYYNFYNIGAYKTSSMSAITRGLWYAIAKRDLSSAMGQSLRRVAGWGAVLQ